MAFDPKKSERGGAVFVILLGIALFAALVFVVSKGSRDASNMDLREKNNLYAAEIIAYGNAVRSAMEQMIMLKDIPDNNSDGNGFLFSASGANSEYGTVDDQPYTEMFNSRGGKIIYQKPKEESCEAGIECIYDFTGQYEVDGAGEENKAELSMVVMGVSEDVCKSLNKNLGYDFENIPTDSAFSLSRFRGSNYSDGGGIKISGISGELDGKLRFCYKEGSSVGRYIYMDVLRSR